MSATVTPHRSPAQQEATKLAVFRGINEGREVKDIADANGISESYCGGLLHRAGYRRVLLSPSEQWTIHQLRRGLGKFTEGWK